MQSNPPGDGDLTVDRDDNLVGGLTRVLTSAVVLIPGAGYLVDMFDLFLFNMVRVKSLTDLGLTKEQVTHTGIQIINAQLVGLIVGAYVWGVLGDRYGRKKVLLGSILIYSMSSLLTAFVQVDWLYGALRFLTGVGLAGELGAGIALISENFTDTRRGIGVGIFIVLGFLGVLLASAASLLLPWRACFIAGGLLGLSLLFFRLKLQESALFLRTKETSDLTFGGLTPILQNARLRKVYFAGIFMLLPSVFIPQILWSLSPEIAESMGIPGIDPAKILGLGYTCVIIGDLIAIWLAEKLKNRKKIISMFGFAGCLIFGTFLIQPFTSPVWFYVFSSLLGFTFGIWVVGATMVAEMFGTNIRATATTTIPNFCRGCAILMNAVLLLLKPVLGTHISVAVIGGTVFFLFFVALSIVKDTYGQELDYADRAAQAVA